MSLRGVKHGPTRGATWDYRGCYMGFEGGWARKGRNMCMRGGQHGPTRGVTQAYEGGNVRRQGV